MHNEDQDRHRLFNRRALVLGCAKTALFATLAGRLYYLQIIEGEKYKTRADDNRISLRLIPPERGRILDRSGRILANNRDNYRVVIVREQTPDFDETVRRLAQILPLSPPERHRIEEDMAQKRAFVPVTVKENISWSQVARIESMIADLPGLSIDRGSTRDYPYGANMAHVLGYVASVSEKDLNGDPLLELPGFRVGKSGLEKLHDDNLRGKAGTRAIEINAYGREIRELKRQNGTRGRDIILTLDQGLQVFTHQRLLSEESAAALVLDIKTGDVLTMASTPSFDPGAFNLGLNTRQWRTLIDNPKFPLMNKAIAGLYAPGSTFKMLVALAAMEEGIGAQGHNIYCTGIMELGNAKFHCWKRSGHGRVNLIQSLQHSCDIYYYDISRRVGINKIATMAEKLGLGQSSGLDLPGEKSGTIPTKAWKEARIGEGWRDGDTLNASIGQGYVLATPLQLAVMTARLASGGRKVTPRLMRGYREDAEHFLSPSPDFEDLGLNPIHLQLIHQGMDDVVNSPQGTARKSRISETGWEMAGKTGTSQVRRITAAERQKGVFRNEDLPWRRRDHALFVGFAPLHNPRYACVAIVEHGGSGSKVAAPIVRDILREAQRRRSADSPLETTEGGGKL